MARLGKGTKNFLLLTLTTNQVRRKGILNMPGCTLFNLSTERQGPWAKTFCYKLQIHY